MNTLTKAFVVVNLILSVAFVAVAGTVLAQRTHWRQRYVDTRAELEGNISDLQSERELLDNQLQSVQTSLAEAKGRSDTLEVERDQAQAMIEELRSDKQQLQIDKERANEQIAESRRDLASVREQLENVREQIAQRERNIAEQEQKVRERDRAKLRLEVRIGQLQLTQRDLQNQIANLSEDARHFERYREFVGMHFPEAHRAALGTVADVEVPARIRATVGDVDMENRLVVLTVGSESDPAVREGYTFLVHRDGAFLAKVKVTAVYDRMSAAEIMEPTTEEPIEIGDSAIFTF